MHTKNVVTALQTHKKAHTPENCKLKLVEIQENYIHIKFDGSLPSLLNRESIKKAWCMSSVHVFLKKKLSGLFSFCSSSLQRLS